MSAVVVGLLVSGLVGLGTIGPVLGGLPSYIVPCKRFDPEIDACIARAIEDLRSRLATGIPELEAPAIEPLVIKHIRLLRGPNGARLDFNITDLKIHGPSNFKVRDLKANVLDEVSFTFKVAFDKLKFDGNYQIDARLLVLRLVGSGQLSGNFSNYDSSVILRARKIYKNNDVYLQFQKMNISLTFGKANLHLSNLFGGDPILGAAGNQVINSNSGLLLEEIGPVLEESLSELFTDVANKITRSFTYDELFPVE